MDSKEYIANQNSEQGPVSKKTSMSTLIIWNVAKVVENNPSIDLKSAIRAAQDRLDEYSRDVNAMICHYPEERHLACALLAWHQLGHKDAESLCEFIESHKKKETTANGSSPLIMERQSSGADECSHIGPVLRLPVATKIVMRLDSVPNAKRPTKKKDPENNIIDKIDAACCLESGCVQRLAEMDKMTSELRARAARLARREADRVELLERAEAAWKDLETGYQRRISVAEEKENDLTKQIQKLVEERNENKNACQNLTDILKEKAKALDKERIALTKLEKEICDRACQRLRKSEEAASLEATLAEQQCKAAQLDRDLRFKEEQAQRRMLNLENEIESAKTLTHEAERAMRGELGAIRDQIKLMSDQLLQEDSDNERIKKELDELRQEKAGMIEDLEGCKITCDSKMQSKMDELKMKQKHLAEFRDKVLECRCKLPVDSSVEAKRTPSLVAVCYCSPEDNLMESCSCTSLRSSLLSNLLSDLFRGLQSELGDARSQMPCQLLKCLEDKHNWDRASAVKSNLRNYFSQLLIGELDIAIATSIEKYHFKWVGTSCADVGRTIPDLGEQTNEDWQERALEQRAQKLAAKLAEQLFQEKADELASKAKHIISSGPPPCKCNTHAMFPCLVKPTSHTNSEGGSVNGNVSSYWRRTLQNVTQLRVQIEDMKKESVKKEDLISMENKIAQIVHQVSVSEKESGILPIIEESNSLGKQNKDKFVPSSMIDKVNNVKKKQCISSSSTLKRINNKRTTMQNSNLEKPCKQPSKNFRKQTFAINVCLCESKKEIPIKLKTRDKILKQNLNNECKSSVITKRKTIEDSIMHKSSVKQTQPISKFLSQDLENIDGNKMKEDNLCPKNCVCFHKKPSNTSIDKMLSNLKKFKQNVLNLVNEDVLAKKASINLNRIETTANIAQTNTNILQENLTNINIIDNKEKIEVSDMSSDELEKKSKDMSRLLPPNIESEYMGAINLDKSNDVICDCTNKEKAETNFTVNCIDTSIMCNCKQSRELLDIKSQQIITDDVKSNELKLKSSEKNFFDLNLSTSNFENYVRNAFPNDYGYFLKFLGVTLTDIDSKNDLNKVVNKGPDFIKTINKHELRNIEMHHTFDVLESYKKKFQEKNICNKLPSCQCNIQISEFRKYVDDEFNKQRGDSYSKTDKALDSQSFMNTELNKQEFCVCCENFDSREVENLEVNTFQLMQDHLKEKLNEFKNLHCVSSCIPPEEEEKLFMTILKGVKDIIENSTMALKCQCSTEEKNSDNFNRAYNLLQEYLKTKVKRVQCSCSITEVEYSVLPSIIEKVRKLIENDFQRLKALCKCKGNDSIKKDVTQGVLISLEIPEKDVAKNVSMGENLQYKKFKQNTSCQVTSCLGKESKSSDAIIMNVVKTNKSTGGNQITSSLFSGSLATQTSQRILANEDNKKKFLFNKATHYKYSKNDSLINALNLFLTDPKSCYFKALCELKSTVSESNMHTRNENNNNFNLETKCNVSQNIIYDNKSLDDKYDEIQSKTILKDKQNTKYFKEYDVNEKLKQPYIGCTLSCSCEYNSGACVCTKSTIQENRQKISDIWKRVTNNVVEDRNMKYLFNDSSERQQNKHADVVTLQTKDTIKDLKETTVFLFESQVNTEEDNVTLKTSFDNLMKRTIAVSLNKDKLSIGTDNMTRNTRNECQSKPLTNRKQSKLIQNLDGENKLQNDENIENNVNDKLGLPTSLSQNCDCNLVPICHVKMLINSIENKLIESKCTCDSMKSEVCPVHYIVN